MNSIDTLKNSLAKHPRVEATHAPTPVEPLKNLGSDMNMSLWAKRDDCTGFGFGGNKVRQLEFYLGSAIALKADTVLITGAVQSNFVRTAATMACRFNMDCHIQLERRVDNQSQLYLQNGNVLLNHLLGATLHKIPAGGDESQADDALQDQSEILMAEGRQPYVIHLGADYPPIGALGYVAAAIELAAQLPDISTLDGIFIPSGSALSHVGLLFGLRALGIETPVIGVCVRRDAQLQRTRVEKRFADLANLLQIDLRLADDDVQLDESALAPGYGLQSPDTIESIRLAARREGLFLDPVYSGKAMTALRYQAADEKLQNKNILFWHTGGLPAMFAYADQLVDDTNLASPA